MTARLELTRAQILAHRRRVGALDARLPAGKESLRTAAWAGLQDSVPRAANLSIHARVENAGPSAWEDPSLVQVWGPRFAVYVVAAPDHAVFTRGRLPESGQKRKRAEDIASRLRLHLAGRRMEYSEAGAALGVHPNEFRYGAPTGTILVRWEGAGRPLVWTVPEPDLSPKEARMELARRYLHVLGPGTAASFARWAGIRDQPARAAFDWLEDSLTPVATPVGDGWILSSDEAGFRAEPGAAASARLLPSGDAYFLLWGDDRRLLLPDERQRGQLWASGVRPGAVMAEGEIVGTWRRVQHRVTVSVWRRLSPQAREPIEAEARALPIPGVDRDLSVTWDTSDI